MTNTPTPKTTVRKVWRNTLQNGVFSDFSKKEIAEIYAENGFKYSSTLVPITITETDGH